MEVLVQTPLQFTWPGMGHGIGWQVPPRHWVFAAQRLLQAPQFRLSDEVSTQKPEQTCRGIVQTPEHMPPTQALPAGHGELHWPQCCGFESRLTQRPLQLVWPGPHIVRHAPATHTPPEPQEFPHAPQLLGSVCVSTHEGPQSVRGRPQLPGTHRLARQSSFGPHRLPQVPQLVRSLVVSVHWPLQSCWLGRHATAQRPFEQTPLTGQTFPHAPQLFRSESRRVHTPLHEVSPAPQAVTHAPFVHVSPDRHWLLHAPQLNGSRETSTHAVPHWARPGVQLATQRPD